MSHSDADGSHEEVTSQIITPEILDELYTEFTQLFQGHLTDPTDADPLEGSILLKTDMNLYLNRLAEDFLPMKTSYNMPLASNCHRGFDPELALGHVLRIVKEGTADKTDILIILRSGILRGNITRKHLDTMKPVGRDKLRASMRKLEVRVHVPGQTLPFNNMNVARFMTLFPGHIFSILSKSNCESSVSRVLSQSVRDKVPARLRFLNVAALSIVLENDEDKQKLLRLALLVNNDFSENIAKLTGRRGKADINKTLQSQQHLGPNMSAFVKGSCEESDLISALAESNL